MFKENNVLFLRKVGKIKILIIMVLVKYNYLKGSLVSIRILRSFWVCNVIFVFNWVFNVEWG